MKKCTHSRFHHMNGNAISGTTLAEGYPELIQTSISLWLSQTYP